MSTPVHALSRHCVGPFKTSSDLEKIIFVIFYLLDDILWLLANYFNYLLIMVKDMEYWLQHILFRDY